MTVRGGVEGAILMSVGAAALTRERAEADLAELVRRGQVSTGEGRVALEDLLARAKGDGIDPRGLVGKLPSGVQDALRDLGLVTRSDLEEIALKLAELDHRLRLVEGHETAPEPEADPDEGAAS
jgi:polyhydroxyalkanoate synthesis regulator phasin